MNDENIKYMNAEIMNEVKKLQSINIEKMMTSANLSQDDYLYI